MLESQSATRVPELVPIRYGRMLASPFSFYRGAAYIMAADLQATPRSGLDVQLCGDAHLSNFGVFASPERRLVFDINDFDETLPGPWEWDVKRLAASFEIAGTPPRPRTAEDRTAATQGVVRGLPGSDDQLRADARARPVVRAPRRRRPLSHELRKEAPSKKLMRERKQIEKNLEKAREKNSAASDGEAHARRRRRAQDHRRPAPHRPDLRPHPRMSTPPVLMDDLRKLFRAYRATLQNDRRRLFERFRFVDLARKVVGVGSVGNRAWIALFLGHDNDDPLFLQVKEAQASVLEEFLGESRTRNHGQRVVEGQRLMQATSDILLGWVRVTGLDGIKRDYYVRQLWDGKASADIENMTPRRLEIYARLCGWTLARGHARSGDSVAISAYLGKGKVIRRSDLRLRVGVRGSERDRLRRVQEGRRRRAHRRRGRPVAEGHPRAAPAA